MATQKPLRQMAPALIKYIKDNKPRLDHATKLQNIFEGQLLHYLLQLLQSEMSERAFNRMKPRVVPINILTRIVNKLSKLYSLPVTREANTPVDQEIMDSVVDEEKIQTVFGLGNKLYNLHQYFAIEPYYYDGDIDVRVLDASQFLVYTDNMISKEMTVFLKFMGQENDLGKQLWFAYSDNEFLAFDTDGYFRDEYLTENQGVNPIGEIPFIYVNQYQTKLMPLVDTDVFEMVLRIPQLLSDLNYAHKFQAHSLVYGIDLDPTTEIDGNPDGFSLFSSREGENKTGKIDFLKPQIEIDASLNLIMAELSMWLETRGIKSGTVGDTPSSISGVAKLLDELDTTQARQEQVEIFSEMESEFWKLYSKLHNYYLNSLENYSLGMTEDPLKSIKYGEQIAIEDPKAKVERIKLKLEAGLTSKRRAVIEANSELDEDQVEELLLEIQSEKQTVAPIIPLKPIVSRMESDESQIDMSLDDAEDKMME